MTPDENPIPLVEPRCHIYLVANGHGFADLDPALLGDHKLDRARDMTPARGAGRGHIGLG